MRIVLNGGEREVADGQTVAGFVDSLGVSPDRVAVELDGEIVKRGDWPDRRLAPGSRLEVVHFVGGG